MRNHILKTCSCCKLTHTSYVNLSKKDMKDIGYGPGVMQFSENTYADLWNCKCGSTLTFVLTTTPKMIKRSA